MRAFVARDAGVTFEECRFVANTATSAGGGLYLYSQARSVSLDACVLERNDAHLGGGVYLVYSDISVARTVLAKNTALTGGGLHVHGSSATLHHCTFWGNAADEGSSIRSDTSPIDLRNSILAAGVTGEAFTRQLPRTHVAFLLRPLRQRRR